MTKAQREQVASIKRACNHPKSALLEELNNLYEVSPKEAEKLGRIIGRLEAWQNTGNAWRMP